MPNSSAAFPDPWSTWTSSFASLVMNALDEDYAVADATSMAVVPIDSLAEGKVVAKERGVLSGIALANFCFLLMLERHSSGKLFRESELELESRDFGWWDSQMVWLCDEGSTVDVGDVVMRVCGPARALLAAERTALNFLQQLSGVATLTAQAASIAGSLQIFDRRTS